MDEESLIFRFPIIGEDGVQRMTAMDPFRIERILSAGLGGEPLSQVIATAKSPVEQIATPAMEKLLLSVQRAFGIKPIAPDGTGCNEKAQIKVLSEYLRWRTEVKKNIESQSISSQPTEPEFSPSPASNGTHSGSPAIA